MPGDTELLDDDNELKSSLDIDDDTEDRDLWL